MKNKIFCIGFNKTGTTSLKKAFDNLGFNVGNQHYAELLMNEYLSGNFDAIIKYCKSAQVFQDFPFSVPNTYKYLDDAYPDSKFILTIRDSPEQWYNSLVRYHSILFGNGKVPTKENLMDTRYVFPGWMWKYNRIFYGLPENDPYNKGILMNHYQKYIEGVKQYFKDRPNDILIINLSEKEAYKKFCSFLNISSPFNEFPWENKTKI
ncbi:sulfotransferase [Evansella sp. AB-rgal1]|uniref:sulfotransferase n=1 Tax=Evansella sp. AB-rgal1 TaxID=3242696 RepID=UPI00359E885D